MVGLVFDAAMKEFVTSRGYAINQKKSSAGMRQGIIEMRHTENAITGQTEKVFQTQHIGAEHETHGEDAGTRRG
jgi:hypothetical protein